MKVVLLFEGDANDSSEMIKEIQTERIINQINSSSNARKISDKMKRGVEEITKAMENTQNVAQDRKKELEEVKITLFGKKDKMKKIQQKLENTRKHIEVSAKITFDLETEANKITAAMEKIKEASQEIDQKYLEQSQNELMNLFVKVTSDAEKAQSDLNATKRMESIMSKKVQEIETDYNALESVTVNETREVEIIISNVSHTIHHIIRSYDEIIDASKDLLKSAISMNTKFVEQNQQYNEVKVAI